MTLEQIIAIADEAYGDGLVGLYHDEPTGDHGDTLAKFIAIELRETYEAGATDSEQLREAYRVMKSARNQLMGVEEALGEALEELAVCAQEKEQVCRKESD